MSDMETGYQYAPGAQNMYQHYVQPPLPPERRDRPERDKRTGEIILTAVITAVVTGLIFTIIFFAFWTVSISRLTREFRSAVSELKQSIAENAGSADNSSGSRNYSDDYDDYDDYFDDFFGGYGDYDYDEDDDYGEAYGGSAAQEFPADAGYLGVMVSDIDEESADKFGMPSGVFVKSVGEGTCAEKAGLKPNDIILAVDDDDITSSEALVDCIGREHKAGDKITLHIARANGGEYEEQELTITLDARPSAEELQ